MKRKMTRSALMILFTSMIMISALSLKGQKSNDQKLYAVIDVIVQDTALLNEGSMEFKIYKDGINTDFTLQTNLLNSKINKVKTHLVIPLSTTINYVRLDYTFKNQSLSTKEPINYNNSLYLFKAGDTVSVILNKNQVLFKGQASVKYTCANELSKYQDIDQSHFDIESSYFKKKDYTAYFQAIKTNQDSLFNLKKRILESYKSKLDERVYDLMLADCWADYNYKLIGRIFSHALRVADQAGPAHKYALSEAYKKYQDNFDNSFLPAQILTQSLKYCDFLYWKEYFVEQAFNSQDKTSQSPFLYRYNSFKKNYTGIIKDKVVLINFYRGKIASQDLNLVYKDAIAKTTDPLYKQALIELINTKIGPAFPFQLQDKDGKIHRLSDYKGKLVVMDFWYTGCINCIVLGKKLKPIIDDFKINPNVAFISVSIDGDKHKDIWLKSLKDEIYSSKDQINLLTQGKNSEIIKHYNIMGYPQLLVISKEGNIITLRPPDPREDPLKFKKFILNNL